ncbi:hypothetical protein, partial [Mycolicibacterium helvum]
RTRARSRLDLQRQLQQGRYGLPPMTADQATQQLDECEQFGRVVAVKQAIFALTSQGMSEDGAKLVIRDLIHRARDLANSASLPLKGVETYADGVPQGGHAKLTDLLSPEDARIWGPIAKYAGTAGDALQLGIAVNDFRHGGDNKYEELGSSTGGVFGGAAAGWGAAALAGSFTGPWTTAAIVVAASFLGGLGGENLGGRIGSYFDPSMAGGGGKSW